MDMKTCNKCSTSKPHSEFNRDRTGKLGLSAYCKLCNRAKTQAWRNENPDGHRDSRYQLWYRMSLKDYETMLATQGGGCAICGGVNPDGKSLAVDHDHNCCPGKRSCGKCVRGLLCSECNQGIGKLKDNASLLRSAADYLDRY